MRQTAVLALAFAATFLSGCQTSKPLPKDFYSNTPENKFPAVGIFAKKPSDELAKLCERTHCKPDNLQSNNLYRELQKSEMFERVANENISDYQIKFAARNVNQNALGDDMKVLASAATLFVLPAQTKWEHHSEFQVTWRGFILAEYQFTIPYEETQSTLTLMKDPLQTDRFVAESAASKFIASAQRDGIFTSKVLYEKLQAENYPKDLHAPVHIGEYNHVSTFIYPDPFLGAQLSFSRPSSQEQERNDVYVYPIRQIEWSDLNKTLGDEIESAKKETGLMVKQGLYKAASFGEPQPISFSQNGKTYTGKVAAGSITFDSGTASSLIYLFINKDKFVKIRMTRLNTEAKLTPQEAEKFVAELVSEITVPDESLFIGSLRQNKRNSTIR